MVAILSCLDLFCGLDLRLGLYISALLPTFSLTALVLVSVLQPAG